MAVEDLAACLTRRKFLRIIGASSIGAAFLSVEEAAHAAEGSGYGTLIDISRCIGCRGCEAACKSARNFPPGESADLGPTAWTYVRVQRLPKPVPHSSMGDGMAAQRTIKVQCMHCLAPACASACPVGALHQTPEGPVVYDEWRCLGCRYCQIACPFQIPRYEWAERLPAVTKCSFCAERLAQGEGPACVAACPVEALKFGRRSDLLAEASRRIAEAPDRYVPAIYGRDEVGGTSMLYVSDVPFQDLGFPTVVRESLPAFTWRALGKIPGLIVGLGATLTALEVVIRKRNERMEHPGGGSA